MRSKQKQERRNNAKNSKEKTESLLNRKIIAPDKLKILVLAGNELITEHLDFLNKCNNLIKLDLSHNNITKLPSKLDLTALNKLEVVFLHHNKIGSIEALQPLYKCQTIIHLTYHSNPLQVHLRNDHEIINSMPNLKMINSRVIFLEERVDYLFPDRPPVLADMDFLQNWKSNQNSEAYYLKVLSLQLQYIDNLWAFNNPIVIIQRALQHFLPQQREKIIQSHSQHRRKSIRSRGYSEWKPTDPPHPLRKWFQEWKKFSDGLRAVKDAMKNCKQGVKRIDKSYMLYNLNEYQRQLRNMKVQKPLLDFLSKIRRKIYEKKMAKKLMANIKLKKIIFNDQLSFYNISGIQQNHRFYYNKSQQHILNNFLSLIATQFNKQNSIQQSTKVVAKQFNAIRLVDPESFCNKYSYTPFHSTCSLLWPSMKVVVSSRRAVATQFKSGFIGIPQLSYIKNRDKVLTQVQLQKSNEVYKRLQKFAVNEYENSLWIFQCKDEFVMKQLLRMIYYHNCKALKFEIKELRSQMMSLLQNFDEPFIVYIDNILKRTCAAVTIQKCWRRYISNKNQPESIYHKMRKNRAALHIQRFFRDSVYRHRTHFSKKLAKDLSELKTNIIIYPLTFYLSLQEIFKTRFKSSLFNIRRLTRNGNEVGLSEQFYRPVFQKQTRDSYFKGQTLGTQNHPNEINMYNLLHYNVSVTVLTRNEYKFIFLAFPSQKQANIASSIIAMMTYQMWGSHYAWPLPKDLPGQWQKRIQDFKRINLIRPWILTFRPEIEPSISIEKKQIQQHGLFIWPFSVNFRLKEASLPQTQVGVQFYQKRYRNYPLKQSQVLSYSILNQVIQQKQQKIESDNVTSQIQSRKLSQEGPLNITTIDKRRFSLFDFSEKSLRKPEELSLENKTQTVIEDKKDKIMKFYQEEFIKKQAQKDLKQTNLAAIRDKAKKQKMLNSTLRSLKEAERTQALRNKVQKVRDFKQRSTKRKQQQEFVQQNNFVIQQQLKMVIMRGKMKDAEKRKETFLVKKSSLDNRRSQGFTSSLPSRQTSRQKARAEEQEINQNQTQTIGEEGSVVNKKKHRQTRTHSIGAYMRDPSFVHGVFPEQYYPIESRGTSFYFPPVN